MASPLRLMAVHRLLIGAFLALAIVYGGRELLLSGATLAFWLSLAVALGAGGYLAYLWRK